jgi:phage gpG-like protein
MPFRVRIPADTADKVGKFAVARIQQNSSEIGATLVEQAKRRFRDQGDEEVRWPDLWANNDEAVSSVARRQSLKTEADTFRRAEVRTAEKRLAKAQAKGKGVARAKSLLGIAKEQAASGNPSYRRGGQALLDSGILRTSITFRASNTEKGVKIEWGPTLKYGRWQQEGFQTQKGVNYIPLTMRGKAKPPGANPMSLDLIPGHDYVILRRVRIPARPFIRLTASNRIEVTRAATKG